MIVVVVSEQSIVTNVKAIVVSTQYALNPDKNAHIRTSGMHFTDSSYLFKDSGMGFPVSSTGNNDYGYHIQLQFMLNNVSYSLL